MSYIEDIVPNPTTSVDLEARSDVCMYVYIYVLYIHITIYLVIYELYII